MDLCDGFVRRLVNWLRSENINAVSRLIGIYRFRLHRSVPAWLSPFQGLLGARRSQEELGGARRSQGEQGKAGRSHGEPGGARGRSQEEPGEARGIQEEPGGARINQDDPGGARISQEEPGGNFSKVNESEKTGNRNSCEIQEDLPWVKP
jgi:hypothetical protein